MEDASPQDRERIFRKLRQLRLEVYVPDRALLEDLGAKAYYHYPRRGADVIVKRWYGRYRGLPGGYVGIRITKAAAGEVPAPYGFDRNRANFVLCIADSEVFVVPADELPSPPGRAQVENLASYREAWHLLT